MIYISKEEANVEVNPKNKKKESQYLLKVVYDSEDTKVHKLLEGIFGEDQMLDVKNGKIAKISSTLTPQERDCFFEMVSETLNKIPKEEDSEVIEEENNEETEKLITEEKTELEEKDTKEAKKVSAEKLIEEFTNFLNSIS